MRKREKLRTKRAAVLGVDLNWIFKIVSFAVRVNDRDWKSNKYSLGHVNDVSSNMWVKWPTRLVSSVD